VAETTSSPQPGGSQEASAGKPEGATAASTPEDNGKQGRDPVVRVTRIVLAICAVIFVWYMLADRYTPSTALARVRSLVVPVVPRVSGYVTEIGVRLHSSVEPGDLVFQLDRRPFELALRAAEASLQQATQAVGAQGATVESAVARLGVARAQLDRAQRNYDRLRRVRDDNPGALSQADWDRTETALAQAVERVASAEADLEKAKEQLGTEGPDNPQVRAAVAALEQAQLDLEFSTMRAPSHGFIESFNVDVGHYAQAGQPLATFVSTSDFWIQADMRENNLGHIEPGDGADIALDVAPGRIFRGRVRSIGYGVSTDPGSDRGSLPTVKQAQGWLRDPQRFPVILEFEEGEARELRRSGAQATVVIYTGTRPVLNTIAWLRIRLTSLVSYVR
jgi:multidrug resistance efflux pump